MLARRLEEYVGDLKLILADTDRSLLSLLQQLPSRIRSRRLMENMEVLMDFVFAPTEPDKWLFRCDTEFRKKNQDEYTDLRKEKQKFKELGLVWRYSGKFMIMMCDLLDELCHAANKPYACVSVDDQSDEPPRDCLYYCHAKDIEIRLQAESVDYRLHGEADFRTLDTFKLSENIKGVPLCLLKDRLVYSKVQQVARQKHIQVQSVDLQLLRGSETPTPTTVASVQVAHTGQAFDATGRLAALAFYSSNTDIDLLLINSSDSMDARETRLSV